MKRCLTPRQPGKKFLLVLLLGYGIVVMLGGGRGGGGADWGEFALSQGCGLEGGLQRRAFVTFSSIYKSLAGFRSVVTLHAVLL